MPKGSALVMLGVVWWCSACAPSTTSATATRVVPATATPAGATLAPTFTPDASQPFALPYIRHQSGFAVFDAAWSPDGTRIASGGDDADMPVWNATTGSMFFDYTGHRRVNGGGILAIAWSPDGTRIASASLDGSVQVWDATTGQRQFSYTGQAPRGIFAVVWSPNGQYLASAPGDNRDALNGYDPGDDTVDVWHAHSGVLVARYHGHVRQIFSIAWSPNGQTIASASDDGTVQIWSALTGQHQYTYTGHSSTVWSVAWSPQGTRLASASQDGTVQIWQPPAP